MWTVAHGATFGNNGGGGGIHVSQGRFHYQSGPGVNMAQGAQPFGFAVAGVFVVVVICLALPAGLEILVGYRSLESPCDQPLAQWLLVDGGVALFLMLLSAILYGRLCGGGATNAEKGLQLAEQRAGPNFMAVAQYEESHRQMMCFEQFLVAILQFAAVIPPVLYIVGAWWRNSAYGCDRTLLSAVFAVIFYKPVSAFALCCCWPCCLGCMGMAAAGQQQQMPAV
mmetsp:Transcript_29050/g.72962  ORF Transcript_29050/g.72962 Transcript_29050/m.72962 type:complete len:225 (-) Transcript_29050:303-977(-)